MNAIGAGRPAGAVRLLCPQALEGGRAGQVSHPLGAAPRTLLASSAFLDRHGLVRHFPAGAEDGKRDRSCAVAP